MRWRFDLLNPNVQQNPGPNTTFKHRQLCEGRLSFLPVDSTSVAASMLHGLICSLLVQWLLFSVKQAVAETALSNSPVPGETAPPEALDNYGSAYRPQIHWSPPVGFM